jgi:hypothetical protein
MHWSRHRRPEMSAGRGPGQEFRVRPGAIEAIVPGEVLIRRYDLLIRYYNLEIEQPIERVSFTVTSLPADISLIASAR